MNKKTIQELVTQAESVVGKKELLSKLQKIIDSGKDNASDSLTIVVNAGVHHLPVEMVEGEIFFASEGSLDFSSPESAKAEFESVLTRVAEKLKEKSWKKVFLVPFGPTNLAMLIKLLVYRVTHIETVDIFHAGSGVYHQLDIPLRDLVIKA